MIDSLRLYTRYVGVSLRGQMQYRGSFIMWTLGQLFVTGIEFLGILVLFDRFGTLRGWSLPEVALLYGMVNVAFSIAEAIPRGFDVFGYMIRRGDFDRVLLRPRSTLLQIAGEELQAMRVGRLVQGLAIMIWAAVALEIAWTPWRVAMAVGAIAGGACIFSGFFVLQATMAFWTVETLEIVNTVTYGGVETAQFPLAIYRPWFREFFTFVIPLACVNYFPALGILGREDPFGAPTAMAWASPLVGLLFLLVTFRIWQFGVRHYTSTGS